MNTTGSGIPDRWWEHPDIADWQHGLCDVYACALLHMHPQLRLGTLNVEEGGYVRELHYFAHDDTYAYDSLGRHALPYTGYGENEGDFICGLDEDPADFWFRNSDGIYVGENGGGEDFDRAVRLIHEQHPWLRETPCPTT